MVKKDWKVNKFVITKNNINTDGGLIKKGTIGKIIKHKISFGSNTDIWYIKFRGHDIIEFTNYDKRFIKIK